MIDEALETATLQTVHDIAALRATIGDFRARGETVALIPTMGALHEGHLALVRAGRKSCRRTVVSIFVNPTQFGPHEDFRAYPRDEAGDLAKLRAARVDVLFMPAVAEMYPAGFSTTVSVGGLSEGLCGDFRPGHFAGVATIVAKLLLQSLPDVALFGEKDYQQLMVIKRLARDLDIPVRIEGVPTVREADGLALSSRNAYLSPAERSAAPMLHCVLAEIAAGLAAGKDAAPLLAAGRDALARAGFTPVQYLEARDAETLAPVARAEGPTRVFAAAYLGQTRLIDNVPVEKPPLP
ncbi:MAG TPA: pantoate--beta-alanine ligase [Alphaproteobacteria bacterium]|nr:pantoate--beta-alanine ligase [Alphaproteobacteria bacterium]